MTRNTGGELSLEVATTGTIPRGNRFGRKPILLHDSPATTFPKQASHKLHTETFVNLAKQPCLLFERESELSSQAIQSERPGTGQKERMERTISVWKIRLGILVYLSRNPVSPGNFPFGKTKFVFPFTFQPKFPDFFCKW